MGFGMKSLAPRTAAGMRWFAADVDGKLCSSVPHQATERGAVRSGARIPSAALAPALQTDAQFSIGKRNKVKLIASLANQASVQARTSPTMPEIAVIGRTNSGKSSLINHLLGKKLAKTSSRAGKTTAIDLYRVNDALVLADVPGYGFEHVGSELDKKWSRVWGPLCESYLNATPSLRAVFFLADVRWHPVQQDREFVERLRAANVPALLVLTKDDRINDRAAGTAMSTHESRSYLTARVRKNLDWPGAWPHIHYSVEAPPTRKKLRRWIDSLCRTANAGEAAALLNRAWAQRLPVATKDQGVNM